MRRQAVVGSVLTTVLLLGSVSSAHSSATATEETLHPTVIGGAAGAGVYSPFADQGAGAWGCYVAGVGGLSAPRGVAILTQITSCTSNGNEAILLPITCPGSACGYAWADARGGWSPGTLNNVCAYGTATFLMEDGSFETVSGGGCGPI